MEMTQFRNLLSSTIAPMLGAEVRDIYPSTPREKTVAYHTPCRLWVKLQRNWSSRTELVRSQPFADEEKALAETFIAELNAIQQEVGEQYRGELLSALLRFVVARQLTAATMPCLPGILRQLEIWASHTYEGQRIVTAIGIDPDAEGAESTLSAFWDEEFSPVFTNGFDTMLVCTPEGNLVRFHIFDLPVSDSLAPFRLGPIASWADNGKVALALNRQGEILAFANGSLRFARRSARWTHYLHSVVIKRMFPPHSMDVRRAVYQSCLDASFARSGGCIGVLKAKNVSQLTGYVGEGDILAKRNSNKSRFISDVVGSKFMDLDRRLRLELIALDGATILDGKGEILAAGAIIEVEAGSTGGGRLAAAKRLGREGLGIKISEDGSVRGYRAEEAEIFSF